MTAIVVDEAMQALYREVDRVAPTAVSVLVVGETGTGKDVVATEIHARSARGEKAMLRLNCGGFGEVALEAELFGHEQGAHEAALRQKEGIFEAASGSTVLLDEVDRLPLAIQAKLALVLEHREVTRAGETEPRPILARVVATTTKHLEDCVERDEFHSDLLLVLAGFTLHVPPLRDRPSEIVPLAEAFVAELASRRNADAPPQISDEARALLVAYSWPGNVRELRNTVEQAVLSCGGGTIEPAHLSISAFATAFANER